MNRLGLRFGKEATKAPILLRQAQSGDAAARDQLIRDFSPFILKTASQSVGRFLHPGTDEEISVAYLAFNEAITCYDQDKGGAFLGFAHTVIKRRILDYQRRERRSLEVPLSSLEVQDAQGEHAIPALEVIAKAAWLIRGDEENRRLEIAEYSSILKAHGLSLAELPQVSPKHQDARRGAIRIGRVIAENPDYRAHVLARSGLPVSTLMKQEGFSRKVLERHRKYILAVALLLMHDLPYLHEYLLER